LIELEGLSLTESIHKPQTKESVSFPQPLWYFAYSQSGGLALELK